MLIVNNGVPKSGSTWVQRIVRLVADPTFPGPEWCNDATNPMVRPEKLEAYVDGGEWIAGRTLIKQHLAFTADVAFLNQPGIRVLVTYRDLPDSVVSWFHHQARLGKADSGSFEQWLQGSGRNFAVRAIRHRESWRGVDNALLLRYEGMLLDAPAAVAQIMQFIDLPANDALAASVAGKTQARLDPGSPLNDGRHIRTAGRSVAREELPAAYHQELVELQAATDTGTLDDRLLDDFVKSGRRLRNKQRRPEPWNSATIGAQVSEA